MVEQRKIVAMWERGDAAALATLIGVEGSSYRSVGARLLVGRDGSYVGSISGGCLEAEIVRKANWLVRDGARVERYSTLFDDTADIPYGLGCGGTVDVLIEPAGTPEFELLMTAMKAALDGQESTVTTWLPGKGDPLRRHRSADPGSYTSEAILGDGAATQVTETLRPPQRLFVLGAGDDAQPLVRFASLLGWTVVVMDGRSQWTRKERFPEAEMVFASGSFVSPRPSAQDAVVVMTHSYEQDRNWLEQVLPCRPRYCGLLGSRHRSALLVAEAAAHLGWTQDEACDHLFAPVGLDLGGDGAEAIALSVVAEVQACVQGKVGHSRRLTPQVIAQQIERGGASRYLQTQCAL